MVLCDFVVRWVVHFALRVTDRSTKKPDKDCYCYVMISIGRCRGNCFHNYVCHDAYATLAVGTFINFAYFFNLLWTRWEV